MVVRAVEWKLPYTGWKAIEITNRKVVNLRLRDENNLIIYNAGDNEIYTDLQLWDEIRPSSEFPVWANVGRAIEDNGWDTTGTLVCFKTTSGDNIKLLYADNWKLFIDNGTWTFKQIYLKSEVDALLALKQDLLTAGDNITIDQNNVISATNTLWPIVHLEVQEIEWFDYWVVDDTDQLVDWAILVFDASNASSDSNDIDTIRNSNWEIVMELRYIFPNLDNVKQWEVWTWMLRFSGNDSFFFPWEWIGMSK